MADNCKHGLDTRFCSLCRAFSERSRPNGAASYSQSGGTTRASAPDRGRWNGEFYVNYGPDRPWDDAIRYGFISGGGGKYSETLQLLEPGHRVWVKIPRRGFVGVGRVLGHAQPVGEFHVPTPEGNVRLLDICEGPHYDILKQFADDPNKCEWFVPVRWLQVVPRENAIDESGMVGFRHTVCRPREGEWGSTMERLKELFPEFDNP